MAEASIQIGKSVVILTVTKESKNDWQRKLFDLIPSPQQKPKKSKAGRND